MKLSGVSIVRYSNYSVSVLWFPPDSPVLQLRKHQLHLRPVTDVSQYRAGWSSFSDHLYKEASLSSLRDVLGLYSVKSFDLLCLKTILNPPVSYTSLPILVPSTALRPGHISHIPPAVEIPFIDFNYILLSWNLQPCKIPDIGPNLYITH